MRRSLGSFALFAAATAGCALTACAAEPGEAGEASGVARSAIIAGKSSPSSQDAVVLLVHTDNANFFASCTGTLIAPNLVLTARHCVSQTVDVPFACGPNGEVVSEQRGGGTVSTDFDPADLYVFTGARRPEFRFGGSVRAAAKGEAIHHDGARVLCGHDLALVRLDRAIEDASVASIRLDGETLPGESLTAVGWGVTTTTQSPSVRQQRTGIVIDAVGPFDAPGEGWAVPRNDFAVGESICAGDSGGPGFWRRRAPSSASSRAVGTASSSRAIRRRAAGRRTVNHFARTSPFKDVILAAFDEAGYEPWVEGGPDPGSCRSAPPARSTTSAARTCASTASAVRRATRARARPTTSAARPKTSPVHRSSARSAV